MRHTPGERTGRMIGRETSRMKHALKCHAVSMMVLFMCSLSTPRCMGLLPRAEVSNHGLTHILRRAARRTAGRSRPGSFTRVQMSEHMTVIHSAGGAELQAAVTPGTDRGWAAIVCHPWGKLGGDMNNPVVVSLRNGLAKRGFTVCRYVPPFSPVFKRMRVFTKV